MHIAAALLEVNAQVNDIKKRLCNVLSNLGFDLLGLVSNKIGRNANQLLVCAASSFPKRTLTSRNHFCARVIDLDQTQEWNFRRRPMQKLEEKLQEQLTLAIEYDFPDVYLTIPVDMGQRLLELISAKGGVEVPLSKPMSACWSRPLPAISVASQ
jgi:hypothetical protein